MQAFLYLKFAMHLPEKGTEIIIIQKMLEHNSIKTTLGYLHTKHLFIKSDESLDDLNFR